MANTISLPKGLNDMVKPLGMSNGLTSVFIEVLVISGSILAKTDREKEMIIWLAQRDQSVVGIGTVGFDIDEMPWTTDFFEREKSFILDTISNAADGLGWEKLNYEPRQDWVVNCLNQFGSMVKVFNKKDVVMDNYREWTEIEEGDDNPTIPTGYPKCEKHDIYLNFHGCILCNNGG